MKYYTKTLNKNNTSGYKGVFWVKNTQKWEIRVVVNKKVVLRKQFKDPKDNYRLLCWNCNCARGRHGICPHEKRKNNQE